MCIIFQSYADYDEMHFMSQWLRMGDNFLDVGANAGLYSLLAASRIGPGKIVAVEPHPKNLALLRDNIELNKLRNIEVLPMAAGSEPQMMTLAGEDAIAGLATSDHEHTGHPVSVVRLDDYLDGLHFAFVKIDVEGFEWPALRGMQKVLDEGRADVILFELNGCLTRYGYVESDFCDWFTDRGFRLGQYDHVQRRLTLQGQPRGNVLAFSVRGMDVLKERLPEVEVRVKQQEGLG